MDAVTGRIFVGDERGVRELREDGGLTLRLRRGPVRDLAFAGVGGGRRLLAATAEGLYEIDRRNPESEFHLSLGISYPNENDIAEAKELGGRLLTGKVALPTMGWMATLEDTQGNVIGVFEKDDQAG